MRVWNSKPALECVHRKKEIMREYKLSAILVTKNEEKKIRRCLESIRWVDEIVVVDQSSSDNTVAICKEYTDKVFVVSPNGFCEPDRPTALAHTTCEWVLYLDADEEVSPALKEEITGLLSGAPEYSSYYIPRKNIFLGKWIKGSGWYPGYVLRLFRKDTVSFSGRIHTDLSPVGSFGYLKNHLEHYTCEDLEEYLRKTNRYTGILAEQEYQKGSRITRLNVIFKLVFFPCAYGARKFFLQKGFIDAAHGLLIAYLTALTIFLMNVKIWEIQRRNRQV
jgi:glycosyltransferase involved in cell wall biosynthesis